HHVGNELFWRLDMKDSDFFELQIKTECPNADEWPTEHLHQKSLVAAAHEARAFMRDAHTKLHAVDSNRDLSPEGKRRQRAKIGSEISAKMEASKTLPRVRETIAELTQKWQDKIEANIKRPTNQHEEAVHAQIRDRLFKLKDGRMSWLEKNIDDTLIAAV